MKANEYIACVIAIVCLTLATIASASSATFTVNSTADVVDATPGDGICDTGRTAPPAPASPECTLRAAVQEANSIPGADTITVPSGTYILTITGRAEDDAQTGDLDVTDHLTIIGAGAATTIIDGGGLDRVFHVDPTGKGITVAISGVTIQSGHTVGIAFVDSRGGAVLLGVANTAGGTIAIPRTSLTIADCLMSNNRASNAGGLSSGGGIANKGGVLNVRRTVVTGNGGQSAGGGISNEGTLTVDASTVGSNSAADGGGLASFGGAVTLTNSAIIRNTGTNTAGGISLQAGSLVMINSTVSGNTTDFAGSGILIDSRAGGPHVFNNSTITNNAAVESDPTHSHGHFGGGLSGGGGLLLSNTIIAGNIGGPGPDCSASNFTSAGYNLIGNGDGCSFTAAAGDIVGTAATPIDARLAQLADNGGSTQTHALLIDSPAIDAGNPAVPGSGGLACAASDARGQVRPADGNADGVTRCDIGAFERFAGVSGLAVLPNRGGNTGSVLTLISGAGFASGATVMLRRAGESDIAGEPVAVGSGGAIAVTTFDLTGKATGPWDVVLTNPDGTFATL